jgi:hypothetical protein
MSEYDSSRGGASRQQIFRLLGDCCNGTLDTCQATELDRMLRTDPEFREIYCDYMAMHASLYTEHALLEQAMESPGHDRANYDQVRGHNRAMDHGQMVEPLTDRDHRTAATHEPVSLGQRAAHAGQLSDASGRRSRLGQAIKRFGSGRGGAAIPRSTTAHMIVAASLIGIALVSSLLTIMVSRSMNGHPVASNNLAVPDRAGAGQLAGSGQAADAVARITGTYNCRWEPSNGRTDPQEIGYGTELLAGQRLRLREGLIEVTFVDGATILLEGPATFVIDASDRVALQTGRLTAVVPERVRGFHILTRVLEIFDAGTEFGLMANESGSTEVHAFSGIVQAHILNSKGNRWRRLQLGATEAARISPVSTTVFEFPADNAQFIRSMLPSAGPHDGLLAYEGFDYPEGPLAAQNGGFGWAGPWFNIAALEEAGPDSNGVQHGSLTTAGIVPLGNRAVQSAQRNRIRRSLATSVGGVFDAAGLVENQDGVRLVGRDGNTVYLSFVQRVTAIDDGFYGLELHRGDGNANRVLSIGNGAEGTRYGATSNVNTYGLGNYPSLGEESTDVNFFVVKISFGVDNRDTVEIFHNPASLRDEEACSVDAVLRGNFAFDRISFSNFDGHKIHEVDELRIGTHFLAVTGRWGGNRGRLLKRITYQWPPVERLAPGCGRYPTLESVGYSLLTCSF